MMPTINVRSPTQKDMIGKDFRRVIEKNETDNDQQNALQQDDPPFPE